MSLVDIAKKVRRAIPYPRIKISEGVDKDTLERAQELAKDANKGKLPNLPFTEANPDWVLLYNHANIGQITSATMRRMKRPDLYYLAGMTFPHPALLQPRSKEEERFPIFDYSGKRWDMVTKLQGNAARAKIELERRNFIWSTVAVVIGATVAAFIGAILGKH